MDSSILIITGGLVDEILLEALVSEEEYSRIIVADGGLLAADKLKLSIDHILGDFDSISPKLLSKYETGTTPIKRFPSKKDKTDTEIALDLALDYNPTRIDIVGATGSRMDHTMANIGLLGNAINHKIDIKIIDKNNRIYLRNHNFIIKKDMQYGDYISLIPYTNQVEGLSLRGFKYPLDSVILKAGSSLGISNEIIESEGIVEFNKGILMVFETKD
ncbi:MAG: thiamine diphosphokinase [Clostridiales bacterium]|nr:thiamine diphosphokinase [Clostridiales bacterium]